MTPRPNALGRVLRYVTDAVAYARAPLRASAPAARKTASARNPLLATMLRGLSWQTGDQGDDQLDYYMRMAVNNPELWASANKIANRVSVDDGLIVKKRAQGQKEWTDDPEHPFLTLLRRPNSLVPGLLMLRETVWWAAFSGDFYWFVVTEEPGFGEPTELWPIPTTKIRPRPDRLRLSQLTGDPIIDYEYMLSSSVLLPGENVVHGRMPNLFDYWQGMGALNALQGTLTTAHAQLGWLEDYFVEGSGVPSAIVSVPPDLSDDELEAVREDLATEFAARRKAAVVRAGDLSVETVSYSMEEMQLYDGLGYQDAQIRKVLGVPEGISSASSGTERLAAEIAMGRDAVQPFLDMLAAVVDLTLMPYYAEEGVEVRCVAKDVVPQDRALAVTEYQTYGVDRTLNENRKEQGLDPIQFSGPLAVLQPLVDEVPQGMVQLAAQLVLGGQQGMGGMGGGVDRASLLHQLIGRDSDAIVAILAGRDGETLLAQLTGRQPARSEDWREQVEAHRRILHIEAPAAAGNGAPPQPAALPGPDRAPGPEVGVRTGGLPTQEQMADQLLVEAKSAAVPLSAAEREAAAAAGLNMLKAAGVPVDALTVSRVLDAAKAWDESKVERAAPGGEIGVNGEFYEGGQFMPSTDKPKQHRPKRKGSGKREVAPYTWETPPSDTAMPIFSLVGAVLKWKVFRESLEPVEKPMYREMWGYTIQELADLWNAGERWVEPRAGQTAKAFDESKVERWPKGTPVDEATGAGGGRFAPKEGEGEDDAFEVGGATYHFRPGMFAAQGKWAVFDAGGKMVTNWEASREAARAALDKILANRAQAEAEHRQREQRVRKILDPSYMPTEDDAVWYFGRGKAFSIGTATEALHKLIGGTKKNARQWIESHARSRSFINSNGDVRYPAIAVLDAIRQHPDVRARYQGTDAG